MSNPAVPPNPAGPPLPPSASTSESIVDAESAGRLVAWAASCAAGRTSVTAAAEAIQAGSSGHVVGGFPEAPSDLTMDDALDWLHKARIRRLTLALPTAGDPLGLSGGGSLLQAAVVAESAAIIETAQGSFGLVPLPDHRGSSYAGVRWQVSAGAAIAPALTVSADRIIEQADRALRRALRAASDELEKVDLAIWCAEAGAGRSGADAALHTRTRTLPPNWPAAARALADRSIALWRVLRVAAADQGAASASGSLLRMESLRSLSHAVREAAQIAYNVPAAALLARRQD